MILERKPREECGIFGVYSKETSNVNQLTYYGLFALQHRGQESAGIVINDRGVFNVCKNVGLVSEAISQDDLDKLGFGNISVGHVRYATTGSDDTNNIQPIVVNHHKGRMALAHNGNLTNSYELRTELESKGAIFHSTTDSEAIAYVIVQERLQCGSIEEAVSRAMGRIEGAYSLIISSPNKLIAARDPHGFRPLCYGKTSDGKHIFASETCALDAVGAEFVRDIEPGEIVTIEHNKLRSDKSHCNKFSKKLCVFEYIYFARPDSIIDGASVSMARRRAGAFLAKEHPVNADIVIGVPDSGLEAALGYSEFSGIPYAIGFTKNKYIGRTFISPTQASRESGVNIKLNPIKSVVDGKRIVLIDDSIVRGTTSKHIVTLLRRAGAKEIHMRVSAPPFVAPCYYGTDVDSSKGLIANEHSVEEIAKLIGVDSLGYLSRESTLELTGCNSGFCDACFGGEYPTVISENIGKMRFEDKIV